MNIYEEMIGTAPPTGAELAKALLLMENPKPGSDAWKNLREHIAHVERCRQILRDALDALD